MPGDTLRSYRGNLKRKKDKETERERQCVCVCGLLLYYTVVIVLYNHLGSYHRKLMNVICIEINKVHKILVIRLYFHYKLYMFRTVSVHLQEQLL